MAQHFAQQLVDLRYLSLAANRAAELRLDHGKILSHARE